MTADEQMGSKDKFWLRLPDGSRWLFKYAGYKASVTGSDWAELLVHALALELGAPSACIALASSKGQRGVISHWVLKDGEELVHGNELLSGHLDDYMKDLTGENPHYSVTNIHSALTNLEAVGGTPGFTAFDQFALYLTLDALAAGRDRHHENWGIARRPGAALHLAPSFDHGNGLGFTERETRAERIAADAQLLSNWLRRGTSRNFVGRPLLVELAAEGVSLCSQPVRREILHRVDSMQFGRFRETLQMIPLDRMSEAHRSLAIKIIEANRRRLLDALTA